MSSRTRLEMIQRMTDDVMQGGAESFASFIRLCGAAEAVTNSETGVTGNGPTSSLQLMELSAGWIVL